MFFQTKYVQQVLFLSQMLNVWPIYLHYLHLGSFGSSFVGK